MTSVSNNSREYCLRWNNHQPNLVTYFSTLYASESFVDVTLVSAEGRKLFAHKLVLSACSPYFQLVFENNPCKHPVVILKDVQFFDLQAIVKFIYNGEVNISQDRINTILKTANSLQVKGLAEVPAEELKRVSSVVGESSGSGISTIRSHQSSPLTSSASWDASDSGHDIPRKKLKKSASATASYVSGSPSTNGDHSASIDSGVGASVSRSIDDGGPLDDLPMPTVVHKRASLPAPPPLLPKSKSLDHALHRDAHDEHEKPSLAEQQRQSYDDSSVGLDRGYDLEVAPDEQDMKMMKSELDEGELDYFDEDEEEEEFYDEDSYGYSPYEETDFEAVNGKTNKTMPSLKPHPQSSTSSSSANVNRVREVLHVSSAALGERRRRGRPLLRQPRIKRSDNEPTSGGGLIGSELYSRDPLGRGDDSNDSGGETSPTATVFERGVSPTPEHSPSTPQRPSIHQSNLPIVRVSQCSPTPPSSPQHVHPPSPPSRCDEQQPVIVSTMSVSTISGSIITPSSSSTMVITPTPQHTTTTLLKVPSTESQQIPSTSTSHSGSGNHLVKQISQPLLPSHSLAPFGGIISGNPVIRRQNSTPAPSQQSRIVQPLKQGTIFQILPSAPPERALSEDNVSKTFIIDLQTPAGPAIEIIPRRELKKENSGEHSGSFSREDSTSEDIGSSGTSSSSFDDGLPVNRSGHCPVLRPGPALGCNFCWNSVDNCGRILRRKTKYHCPECHINLCIVPCFQDYHEKADKKKKPRSKLGLPKPSSM